jgi:hypothetical protein
MYKTIPHPPPALVILVIREEQTRTRELGDVGDSLKWINVLVQRVDLPVWNPLLTVAQPDSVAQVISPLDSGVAKVACLLYFQVPQGLLESPSGRNVAETMRHYF